MNKPDQKDGLYITGFLVLLAVVVGAGIAVLLGLMMLVKFVVGI